MNLFTFSGNRFFSIVTFLCLTLATQNIFARQALDKIIAVVNDDVISQNELNSSVNDFIIQLKLNRNNSEQIRALTKQVLEKLIVTRIQLQMAKQHNIVIDDISLNRMIENIAESNNLSLAQLKDTLAKDGIEFARFREQTREDLITKQLQQRVIASKINISDQEVQRFIDKNLKTDTYNKYQISHILIATPESATPEDISNAKEKAEQLYNDIKNGADFKTLAINHSDGRNALQGGDLGLRSGNELPEAFIEAVAVLARDETAAPIQSASGFHILKLVNSSTNSNVVTQTLARHILLRTSSERSDEEAQRFLGELKQRIEQGADFAKLANEYSQDPGSKIKGGDLGWADPGTYVAEFEDTMDSLIKNEISSPFRSQFGWHILQVLDRRAQDKTQANMEAQARQSIYKRKYEEELLLWLRRIRDESYVEYVDKPGQ
ncbi:MAG: peptidylprolyl isomerase [Gammaproteobacteria bacterium]|nr:peptidylprolyl isomerase [Gammaproteobacteria bacterium]